MPCTSLLTLTFNIGFDYFRGCSAGGQQAEALTPECLLPQPALDIRMFFLNQTAAGTLIGVDKSADLAFGVGFEKDIALAETGSSNTFLLYFTTRTR